MTQLQRRRRVVLLVTSAALTAACTNPNATSPQPTAALAPTTAAAHPPTTSPTGIAGTSSTVESPSTTSLVVHAPEQLQCAAPLIPDTGGGPIQLDMWSVLSTNADLLLRQQVADFNSSQALVTINLETAESSDQILRRLGNGERPDLLSLGVEGLINLTDAGLVTDVEGCIRADPGFNRDDLLPVAAASYQLRGEQVSLPLTVSTPVLFYNRTTFEHAGLNPDDPPQTLADLRSDLEKILTTHAATTGLTFADAAWFVNQWAAQLSVSLASSGNGHDIAARSGPHLTLSDPKLIETLDELRSMAAAGLITPKAQSDDKDLLALIDPRNPAAMAFHTSGSTSRVYDIVAGLTGTDAAVGVAPFPGPGKGGVVGGAALWMTTPDQSKVWAVWTAMRFLTDATRQAQYGQLGYAPARLSSLQDPDLQAAWLARPGLRVGFDQLNATSPDPSHLPVAIGTQSNLSFRLNWAGEDIADASRNVSAAQALERAERDAGANLAVYNSMRYGAS